MTANLTTLRQFLFYLLLCAVALASPLQAAERRVALVIGNASYADKPLRNPVNDASDLAAALKRMGFEVMERKNRTADQLRGDLSDFQDKLSPGAVGLFYFAGHGVQAGRGQNYLLPVGVTYKRERDAESYGLEVGSVLRRMEDSGAALSLVILDACRDSPLPTEGRSTASRGLGRMEAPSGSMIAFATAPGSTADENAVGRNGLYTQHLLAAIEAPGVRLEDVFKRVRRGVEKDSNRRQSPEEIMKLTSDEPFYFKPGNAVQVASIKPEPVTPTARPGQATGLSLEDLEKEDSTRKQWAQWQAKMKADFDKTAAFAGSADLKVKAWERFIAAWGQDNPLSREDDDLRSQAAARLQQLNRQTSVVTPALASPTDSRPQVRFATSAGDFVVELYPDKAPRTVENFLQYVKDKHYDGTIFHRVIGNFMIQGGGYDANLTQKTTRAPIQHEGPEALAKGGPRNLVGTLAMARTSNPNSATAQFFINVKDNAFLDPSAQSPGYTAFGKVVSGMDVVDAIKTTPTGPGGPFPADVPKTTVLINSATLVK